MRLKSIKLAGFKSFVDPTTVTFKSNMTAIVGPNGCGKSNVIDAVRWVMGESSAKYLRGESMTDVIFNGSSQRKPVSQASIELLFDNSSGSLGGAYADYAEISVKRVVTRDSQSGYFLNGSKCRRRDITDLFLGTGLGSRSYAIIEQGMISRLIEARPEELRIYLEEAAGISKYKERRRETENRIKRTQENLERLSDLREELGKQLERLGRQAQAAKYYQELKQQERKYKSELAVLRWRQADNQLAELLQVLAQLELEQEACLVTLRQGEAQLETTREDQAQASDAYDIAQKELTNLSLQIARLEQGFEHQLKREQQINAELAQLAEQEAAANLALEQDAENLAVLEEQLENSLPQVEEFSARLTSSSQAVKQLEDQLKQLENTWNALVSKTNLSQRNMALLQAQVQQTQVNLDKNLQRQASLQASIQQEDSLSEQAEQLEDLSAELLLAQEQLSELEQQEAELREQRLALQEQQQQIRQRSNQLNSQQQQHQGRLASLQALQQAELAGQDAELENWLAQSELNKLPRLSQVLRVEQGWETALETALHNYLAALLNPVPVDAHLTQLLTSLPSGQLKVFHAHNPTPQPAPELSLLAKIHNPEQLPASLAAQLANIYTVANLSQAQAQLSQLTAQSSFITPEGTQVFIDGVHLQATSQQGLGLLARQQAMQRLEEDLALVEQQLEDLILQEEQQAEQLVTVEEQLLTLQAASRQLHTQIAELNRQEASAKAKLVHQQAARTQLQTELLELQQEHNLLSQNLLEQQEELEELLLEAEGQEEANLSQQDARNTVQEEYEQQRQNLAVEQEQLQEAKLNHQLVVTKLAAAQQALERLEMQSQAVHKRQQELLAELAANASNQVQNAELEDLLVQHKAQETKVVQLRQAQQQAQEEQRHLESQRSVLDKQLNGLRQRLEEQRLVQHSLMLKRDTHLEQLQELQTNLNTVMQSLSAEALESTWQTNLDTTLEKIKRLGAINLAAIDEYDQQAERKNYLDAQNAELEDALATLDTAIKRIDRETRQRFKETFEQVNQGLQNLFPKIFGGGRAWLELTGDNLLETGVAIMARPPGKKNSTIHLLSGGEKALTALALVFSIFELNPAPFCMLDEVDAPLDDANVGRYARLVKEMSARIQFIYITHNKQAMESAEQLMGVTMQEPGVSRLVSVDLAEASAMVAS